MNRSVIIAAKDSRLSKYLPTVMRDIAFHVIPLKNDEFPQSVRPDDNQIVITDTLEIAWQVRVQFPDTKVVLLLTNSNPIEMRAAVRSGIEETVVLPDELAGLPARLQTLLTAEPGRTGKSGVLFGVYSGNGGLGRTTLACALAQAYAALGTKTLLVDLNLAIGGVETSLGITPPTTLADLMPVIAELDPRQLAAATVQCIPNLDVLCSPRSSSIYSQIGPEQVERLLSVARESHYVTVLDMPTTLSPTGLAELKQADQIVYLMTADPISVSTLASILPAMEQGGVDRSRISIVQRLRGPSMFEIAGAELANQIGIRHIGTLPFDWSLQFRSQGRAKHEADLAPASLMRSVSKLAIRLGATVGLPVQIPAHAVKQAGRGFSFNPFAGRAKGGSPGYAAKH